MKQSERKPGASASLLPDPGQGDTPAQRRMSRLALLGLVVLTVVLIARGMSAGGFRFSDASRHAMDGVFIHDFVADMPDSLMHPMDYTMKYYAQYPSLGIVLYYPPFFAMVEAVFYALFGISAVTARLTVLVFAVVGVMTMYKLLREITSTATATLCTALFVCLPSVVFWSRQVMLEMPTTAMILAAAYYCHRYVEHGHRRSALWTGLLVVAAVMTKQTAAFLVPAFGLYLLARRRWGYFKHWQLWVAVAIMAAVLVPYFIISFHYATYLTKHVGGDTTVMTRMIWRVLHGWALILTLPGLIALTTAALICVVWEAFRPRVRATWLLASMFVLFFAESVYLRTGGLRYPILIMPIMVSFGGLLLWRIGLLKYKAVVAAAGAGVLVLGVIAYAQDIPFRRGHADAARQLVARSGDARFVLFEGDWDGDTIFFVRQNDPDRRVYVLRGSKMLYSYASFRNIGYRDLITSEEGLKELLQDFGISVVAVEDHMMVETGPGKLLRQTLEKEGKGFTRVAECPVFAPRTRMDKTNILVYTIEGSGKPRADSLRIPMIGLGGRVLVVPLKGGGRPRFEKLPSAPATTAPAARKDSP